MPRDYQWGDYDNTVVQKILQNQAATIDGSSSVSISGGHSLTGTPRDFSPGDSDNNILQKILENEADVIRGVLVYQTA